MQQEIALMFDKKAYSKAYYEANKEKIKASCTAYYEKNKGKRKAQIKAWQQVNEEKKRAYSKAYYEANAEELKAKDRAYSKANRDKKTANENKRYASKLNRTPSWLTKEDLAKIEDIFRMARKRTQVEGIQYHVDHIIPLQGKNISGLHVPSNLQILRATENLSKGNRYGER